MFKEDRIIRLLEEQMEILRKIEEHLDEIAASLVEDVQSFSIEQTK